MDADMDLDLDGLIDQAIIAALPRGRRGSPKTPPTLLREITPEDFPAILNPKPADAKRPMQRLRHTHHMAARCMAEGRSPAETSAITGYTTARLAQLQHDPAFKELMAYYKDQLDQKWLNVHERLASLGIAVTEELQHRLEEDPDKLSNEELRRWAETLLDRSGFGPSKTANLNVKSQSLSLNLIEQVKREAQDRSTVKLLAAE